MEVHHKPKPFHNWRELLTELTIVVLGVGIALGAEQTVEWLHWQHRVADASRAIELELRDDDGPAFYIRAAAVTCFEQKLDGIHKAIEEGRPRAETIALIRQYAPPSYIFDRNAWDTVLAGDVASHVVPEKMIRWGYIYSYVVGLNEVQDKESDNLTALNPIHQSGDKLSAGEADAMLAAVARLRTNNRSISVRGGIALRFMQSAGISLTQAQKSRILGDLRSVYPGCVVEPSTSNLTIDTYLTAASQALKRKTAQP